MSYGKSTFRAFTFQSRTFTVLTLAGATTVPEAWVCLHGQALSAPAASVTMSAATASMTDGHATALLAMQAATASMVLNRATANITMVNCDD